MYSFSLCMKGCLISEESWCAGWKLPNQWAFVGNDKQSLEVADLGISMAPITMVFEYLASPFIFT